jgi:GNAT superfamily N-acetyltransferase
MQWLTTLSQMDLEVPRELDFLDGSLPSGYSWSRFRWEDLSKWIDWLDGTYIGSLDCPELNGIRSTPMTLRGYWALTGVPSQFALMDDFAFRTDASDDRLDKIAQRVSHKEANVEWWGLFSSRTKSARLPSNSGGGASDTNLNNPNDLVIAAGCMLSQNSDNLWELTYMGVQHDFRRRGLGKACLAKAIERVVHWNGTRLSLALDVRNRPCEQLYNAFGFNAVSEIDAWIFNPLSDDPP